MANATAEVLKTLPVQAAAIVTYFGFTLEQWVSIIAIVYGLVQLTYFVIFKWVPAAYWSIKRLRRKYGRR